MPQKVAHYATVSAPSLQDLDKKVNFAISKGWQPLGGVSTMPDHLIDKFIQAMVAYSESN